MRLFNKKHLEIVKFSTTDPTRIALHGLLFDGNKTVATDGHRLICVESEQKATIEDWPVNGINWSENDKPFTVSRSTIEKALKNIPKVPNIPAWENAAIGLKVMPTGEPDKVVCQTTDFDNTDNVESRTVAGKFPNYQQVIPNFKDENLYQRVGVNGKYLKEVCMLLEKYCESSHVVTLYLKKDTVKDGKSQDDGQLHSMVVTADNGEGTKATAVIMPIRL